MSVMNSRRLISSLSNRGLHGTRSSDVVHYSKIRAPMTASGHELSIHYSG
jgi:hypothetical protein